ncbi:MAG: hypothetical protein CME63_07620 [Halobacteriovoraceae bacterium]|jgi:FtsP/CotA-like multicopper oxidase with cupredoxin domain|nr:hypothetical protein [Halobacteriovoraceae bacterium]|tara:strand:+ start:142 stop:465 length:324 start_codon:yes stop_codon:yes gene_type:complete
MSQLGFMENLMFRNFSNLCAFIFLFLSLQVSAAERFYDLRIKNITANFTGVDVKHALGISQTWPAPKEAAIPAPTLRFKLGDDAVITVHNDTDEPATLHWHGLLVPY